MSCVCDASGAVIDLQPSVCVSVCSKEDKEEDDVEMSAPAPAFACVLIGLSNVERRYGLR